MSFTVGLLTNEPILAEGFSLLVAKETGLRFAGTFADIREVWEGWDHHSTDVLVVDQEAALDSRVLLNFVQRHPALKVILWTHSVSIELAYQAMAAGVRGILRRSLSFELHCKCMMKVAEGEMWFEKDLLQKLLTIKKQRLTKRESELVYLVSIGAKNKEIAHELFLEEGTVKVYLSKLFRKLGVKDRYELALYGLKNLASNPAAGTLDPRGGHSKYGISTGPLGQIALHRESEAVSRSLVGGSPAAL